MSESLVTKKYFGTGQFPAHALIDTIQWRVLAVSYYSDTIVALQSCELNTKSLMKVNQSPNLLPQDFDNFFPWEYVWAGDRYNRENNKEYSSLDLDHWQLINEKASALDHVHLGIQMYRRPFQRDMLFQHDIYRLKLQDARAFIDNPDIDLDLIPFVRDYAQLLDTDPEHAANAIILQSDIFKSRMAESDALRIKYTLAIRQSSSVSELAVIVKDFQKECFAYGTM